MYGPLDELQCLSKPKLLTLNRSPLEINNSTEPLLKVDELVCGYHNKAILSKVSFSVYSGQHWAIIGENGEGKSTLLRTLVGLLKPLGGFHQLFPESREISHVPQHPTRDFRMPMTVEDFIGLGFPIHHRYSSKKRKEFINIALNRLGLTQRKEDISILSGGQFQRAVLARSLVHYPCMLFLDEPARGLDQKSNTLFMDELRCCPKHTSPAIVMVLHDLRLLKKNFSHILWIKDGRSKAYEVDQLEENVETMAFLEGF
jgi:ABC-type Mn2+/Zn2+ transport system ATPase subunit